MSIIRSFYVTLIYSTHVRDGEKAGRVYLSVREAVIDNVEEPVSAHSVPRDGRKLRATFRCLRFGEINDREVGPFH